MCGCMCMSRFGLAVGVEPGEGSCGSSGRGGGEDDGGGDGGNAGGDGEEEEDKELHLYFIFGFWAGGGMMEFLLFKCPGVCGMDDKGRTSRKNWEPRGWCSRILNKYAC